MKTIKENESVIITKKFAFDRMSEAYRSFTRMQFHGANTAANTWNGKFLTWREIYIACGGNYNAIEKMMLKWEYKRAEPIEA